jgi:hypothetical protein
MAKLLLPIGGFIFPAVAGALGYPVWLVPIWAAVFHLIARSDAFRSFASLPTSPDRSSAPLMIFLGGWLITLLPMLIAYAAGWGIAWLL